MADSEPTPDEVFDPDKILQLVELMKDHGLTEIDLRQSGRRIKLRRAGPPKMVPYAAPVAASPIAAQGAETPPAANPPADDKDDKKNIVTIKSPMVGTFFNKSNPDADAFVKLGDRIEPETTVCIIEAMKVFNEINAEVTGQIVAILVENEEAVEYGKPLFEVDTSK